MSAGAHMWTHANPLDFARMVEHLRPGTTDYLACVMRTVDKPDYDAWESFLRHGGEHPYAELVKDFGLEPYAWWWV